MLTRNQDASLLKRIIDDIFCIEDTDRSPIVLALQYEGINGMLDLTMIREDEFDNFQYIDPDNSTIQTLNRGNRNLIRLLSKFISSIPQEKGRDLDYDEWLMIDKATFDKFRLFGAQLTPTNSSDPKNTTTSNAQLSFKNDPVIEFKKGIKRDSSVYPILKDQRSFQTWNRQVVALAREHDVSEIFNTSFVAPDSSNNKVAFELYQAKQAFVFSVFNRCITTDQGKAFVRDHEYDVNAQEVYRKLVNYSKNSTAAKIEMESLIQYLSTAKLDSAWKGTTESFILDWQDKMRALNEMIPTTDQYSSSAKKRMLECAVRMIPELYSIKTIENNRIAAGQPELTFENYVATLLAAAVQRDNALSSPVSRNQHVYNLEFIDLEEENHTQHINLHKTQNPYRVPKEAWDLLSPEIREIIKQGVRAVKDLKIHETMIDPVELDVNKSEIKSHDIRNVLSPNPNKATVKDDTITLNGKKYRQVNHLHISVFKAKMYSTSSLIDRGANGGLAGEDVRLIETTMRKVDVTGIDNYSVKELPIATVGGLTNTQRGPVILILHQYAFLGKGKSIHSSIQLENFGVDVDDKSIKMNGKQRLLTPDGYLIPLNIRDGLCYLDMRPPTDLEMESLPHVCLTSDADWDHSIFDNEYNMSEIHPTDIFEYEGINPTFDSTGTYLGAHFRSMSKIDFDKMRPNFAWLPSDVIKKTFEHTTQYARSIDHLPFRKHFKSRFPALNIHRRNENVATDTIFADVRAIDNGSTCAQIFVGIDSGVTDIFGMKLESDFVSSLQDVIRKRGAMNTLISDRAKSETSKKALDILRHYVIKDFQSEPYHEHQNAAERRYQTVKRLTVNILNHTGAPPNLWLLAMEYVCYVLNHTSQEKSDWMTPLTKLEGTTTDISALLEFYFYEPVYFASADKLKYNAQVAFPSGFDEEKGRFVGIAENIGDALTYKVLSDKTHKIIYRSYVRTATDLESANHRLEGTTIDKPNVNLRMSHESVFDYEMPSMTSINTTLTINNEDEIEVVGSVDNTPAMHEDNLDKSETDIFSHHVINPCALEFDPKVLIGRSFLEKDYDDECRRVTIKDYDATRKAYVIQSDEKQELIDYVDAISYLSEEFERPQWLFIKILSHDHNTLKIMWEDGSISKEQLHIFGMDHPALVAEYGKTHNLLEFPEWQKYRRFAKNVKKLTRALNQAKLHSFRHAPMFQYGIQVPRNEDEALELDKRNGNNKWKDAMDLETSQLHEYETFKDIGKNGNPPCGYKKIKVHFVFSVKHDGRFKARLVADGHLTKIPLHSVYSGVVSLRTIRITLFLAELNDLLAYSTDVGNAYLEAFTHEKVYIIAGPGFGELEGHTLLIIKALYGLKSSGQRWHDRLFDILTALGFSPSKADPDVWMKKKSDHYEYIDVYVDDLVVISKDPETIIEQLKQEFNLKFKGTGPINFYLGCDFTKEKNGILTYGPKKYIGKMIETFERMFGEKPHVATTPMCKDDHPELDESELLADNATYQSMIGHLQWCISLGRFDIFAAVTTMSSFRIQPRVGHLERLKRIYGYLRKYPEGCIRIRTHLPNFEDLEQPQHNWDKTVYSNAHEEKPLDAPEPLGPLVRTTSYVDANLYHDKINGRSLTGIIHLLNATPIDWYCKRQGCVETSTYGSEIVAARIACEQISDLRLTLRYLGVNIDDKSFLFGDSDSVIKHTITPDAIKRHNALAFHRVREMIASGIVHFFHIGGHYNPADIMTKHLGHVDLWRHVKPLLFWAGDTKLLLQNESQGTINE